MKKKRFLLCKISLAFSLFLSLFLSLFVCTTHASYFVNATFDTFSLDYFDFDNSNYMSCTNNYTLSLLGDIVNGERQSIYNTYDDDSFTFEFDCQLDSDFYTLQDDEFYNCESLTISGKIQIYIDDSTNPMESGIDRFCPKELHSPSYDDFSLGITYSEYNNGYFSYCDITPIGDYYYFTYTCPTHITENFNLVFDLGSLGFVYQNTTYDELNLTILELRFFEVNVYNTSYSTYLIETKNNEIKELQEEIAQFSQDYEELQQQYEELQQQYNELQQQYDSLYNDYMSLIEYGYVWDERNFNHNEYACTCYINDTTYSLFDNNCPLTLNFNHDSLSFNMSDLSYATNDLKSSGRNVIMFDLTTITNGTTSNSLPKILTVGTTSLKSVMRHSDDAYIDIEFMYDNNSLGGIFGVDTQSNNGTGVFIGDSSYSFNRIVITLIFYDYTSSIDSWGTNVLTSLATYQEGYNQGVKSRDIYYSDLQSNYDDLLSRYQLLQSNYDRVYSLYEHELSGNNFTTLFFTIAETPFSAFKQIWNVDFLGVNLAGFVTGILFIGLILWLIKKIF